MSVQIDPTEPKEHFLEIERKKVKEAFDQEFSKTYPNHMAMCRLAMTIYILVKRLASNSDTAHSERLTIQLDIQVHEVKKTYNPLKSVIVTCFTVAFHVGSGALGMVGAFHPALAAGAVGVDWKGRYESFSKTSGVGATVCDSLGRIFSESSAAQRTGAENLVGEVKRRRDERDGWTRQDEARMNDTLRDSKEAIQGEHQAKQQITG